MTYPYSDSSVCRLQDDEFFQFIAFLKRTISTRKNQETQNSLPTKWKNENSDRRHKGLSVATFVVLLCGTVTAIGIQLPFWQLYLLAKRLGAAEIGQILSAAFFIKILTNPLAAHSVDRYG
jgi:hypothetical protein